jgi:surface antigen
MLNSNAPGVPSETTVTIAGALKTAPNHTSPAAIDAQQNPVMLSIGTAVRVAPDPHTGQQSTPPGIAPAWTHIDVLNGQEHGWFLTESLKQPAAAQFQGTVMDATDLPDPAGLTIRGGPGIGFPPTGRVLAPGTNCMFDAWTLGSAHLDPFTKLYDDRWFRIAGTTTWVPSASIKNDPPANIQKLTSPQYRQVLHDLLNIANLPDPDGNYLGQCVSFVKQFTHRLGVSMMPLGGNGGALNAYTNWNSGDLSLRASQASRFPFTGTEQPQEGDIVVFDATQFNQYGHIGVVQSVIGDRQFILQQSNYNDGAPTNTIVDCATINLQLTPAFAGLGTVMGWLRLMLLDNAS